MKLKILLINLKSPVLAGQKKTYMPPVHLWKMRSTLEKIKYVKFVNICDEHIGEDCRNLIKIGYDIIGISCRFSIQNEEYLRVANIVKKPGTLVIGGGYHAAITGLTEKPDAVDAITRMRGEEYFLATFEDEIKDINYFNIPFFENKEVKKYWDLNRPHDLQSKTKKWMSVISSVGCDRQCGFCGIRDFSGCWQPYSTEYMKNYFDYLKKKGILELFFEDDNISWDKNRFLELMDLIKQYGFWWSCPNGIYVKSLFDAEVLSKLRNSGCWRLSLPFETGSTKTAIAMGLRNKWLEFEEAEEIVSKLKEIGIQTCGFFIIGYPGETEDDIYKTLKYANDLDLDQRNIYIATPYPGTKMYKECLEKGWIKKTDTFYSDLLYKNAVVNTPWLSAERVMELKEVDRQAAIKRLTNINLCD